MKNTCVFPGTFDPFTLGHRHVVVKALERYERVIVAVAELTYKKKVLPSQIRKNLAVKSLANLSEIVVECFSGMLTDYLAQIGCFDIVRGYRNEADLEYERELEKIYVSMDKRVNFVLLPSDIPTISGEIVRERVANNLDISDFVCPDIIEDVKKYYKN